MVEWMNILAIFIATILSFIVGALWYSPLLFVKPWMRELKISPKDVEKSKKKGMAKELICSFLGTLLFAFVYFVVLSFFSATTLLESLFVGVLIWLGFIATTMLNGVIFEKRSLTLYAINSGHYLVTLLVMSLVYYLF